MKHEISLKEHTILTPKQLKRTTSDYEPKEQERFWNKKVIDYGDAIDRDIP
ncbi:MAG: hypothetical protein KAS32_20430 [Candidatus Peribacteraceae bacterium]|nr:hypothetical protein [Candidatus Peribacteraceae bacterium]